MSPRFSAIAVVVGSQSSRAAKRGGFKRGGFPIWTCPSLFCPFSSFLGLSRFARGFSRFARGWSGIFPISPFPLSRPIKSPCEEQSRKGPRHNPDLSRKVSGKHPGLETPRFSFSQAKLSGPFPLLNGPFSAQSWEGPPKTGSMAAQRGTPKA